MRHSVSQGAFSREDNSSVLTQRQPAAQVTRGGARSLGTELHGHITTAGSVNVSQTSRAVTLG